MMQYETEKRQDWWTATDGARDGYGAVATSLRLRILKNPTLLNINKIGIYKTRTHGRERQPASTPALRGPQATQSI